MEPLPLLFMHLVARMTAFHDDLAAEFHVVPVMDRGESPGNSRWRTTPVTGYP